jgi:NHL repeat-containing protein
LASANLPPLRHCKGSGLGVSIVLAAAAVLLTPIASAERVARSVRVLDPCPAGAFGPGWCGDGGAATDAVLAYPEGVAPTKDGGFLIADTRNNVVRRVSPTGVITRVAGIGLPGESPSGILATAARLRLPSCVSQSPDGSILVRDDAGIHRISRTGTITQADNPEPCRDAVYPNGDRLVVDRDASLVERISASGGSSTVVAGNGDCAYSGDGVPATDTALALPSAVAVLPDGGFLIADTENHIIRRVSPDGVITTVAGRTPPLGNVPCGASGEYGTPIYVVLLLPLHARAYHWPTVRFETTYDISVLVTIRHGSRVMARIRGHATSGVARMTLHVALPAGRYSLDLQGAGTAIAAGEQKVSFTKHDLETLVIGR